MRKTEVILLIAAFIGFIFKLQHWTGAGILVVSSLMLLSILYFPFGLLLFNDIKPGDSLRRTTYRNLSTYRIWGSVGLGIALSAIASGILFKVQHYPGVASSLSGGVTLLLIILVISLFRYDS